jgi:3-oxoacyl-[acyl-carrier protein] reductase
VLAHYGRSKLEAEALVTQIRNSGGRGDVVQGNPVTADGPHRLAAQVREIVGERLDILVANAGSSKPATLEQTIVEDFDELFAVNVRAPLFLIQQLLPILRNGSSITLVSSLTTHAATDILPVYSDTKGAVDTLVKHLAFALGPDDAANFAAIH